MCCEQEDDEVVQSQFEDFNCEECPWRLRLLALPDDCQTAIRLHARLANRATVDLHLTPLVFDIARLRMERRSANELLDMIFMIHKHRCPPPKRDKDDVQFFKKK